MEKNISVITNFGCRSKCWYCIWKGHELEYVRKDTNWIKLRAFLDKYKNKGKVSVSGGGDCLYKYDDYAYWWNNFFDLAKEFNMLVDIHTREKFYSSDFWENNINRCVFSSDNLNDDIDYLSYLNTLTKIRVTHLVTAETTDKMIENYLKFKNEMGCQFTIKQLVGFDDNGRYKEIREKYPEIYHLDAGDYNIYYMPDNSIREKFL